ncbi:MAG: Uncharacterized protein G01um101416_846 [Microgenomates group bacterium Gr01-1014_16]|nr:MAG: Uncharacterized protein G01um101416_846 [Microgenomates group bacterium Gr01-1014_16]
MKLPLTILQIVLGVLVSGLILLQAKGTGLGRTSFSPMAYHSRRGFEKLIFKTTVILTSIFVLVSAAGYFVV